MKHNQRMTAGARDTDQLRKHRSADPAATPIAKYRHAPNVTIGQQTPRGNRYTLGIPSQYVLAVTVQPIPFERLGYALLLHENLEANGAQLMLSISPRDLFDPKGARCTHGRQL